MGLTEKPKILCVGQPSTNDAPLLQKISDEYEVVHVATRFRAFANLARNTFAAIYIFPNGATDGLALAKWTQSERILESMPDGVALLDDDNTVVWANDRLKQWSSKDEIGDVNFYSVFEGPEILGPDFCPFHSALATGEASGSLLRCCGDTYYHVHAAPVHEPRGLRNS